MEIWAIVALIGLVLGALAFIGAPGNIRGGIVPTMVIGAVAAVVMTWIGAQTGIATQGTIIAFFIAMIGTGLVLAIWRTVRGPA